MKKCYIPCSYYQSIYTIDYEMLKKEKIKLLLIDVDNTIASSKEKYPTEELISFFKRLEEYNFIMILFSNATKKRLKPFKEQLNIDTSFLSFKPFSFKYRKIMSLYNVKAGEIVAIGDQLLTDIKGANRLGIKSILVNPLSKKESLITKFNRLYEYFIYKKMEKEKILKRGEYFE